MRTRLKASGKRGVCNLRQVTVFVGAKAESGPQSHVRSGRAFRTFAAMVSNIAPLPQTRKMLSFIPVSRTMNAPSAALLKTVEDAREAFLLELSSFNLQLKKAVMVCEAEARQVEEYYRERQRIEDEHGSLRGQLEQLKTSLEHAQVERKRKIEYDSFAEKINTLPSRAELELCGL
ncbi:Tho complex subunit 7-domain-containing protein [Russula compacta]|nr:Tho complex subunit 7-domain-containing protein [Russula compacta]